MMLKWHVASIIPRYKNHRYIYYDIQKHGASVLEASRNGLLLSAKLLLRPRSLESYFEGKLGVNLKATHVESIEDGKMYRGNATKENERRETGSKITRATKRQRYTLVAETE